MIAASSQRVAIAFATVAVALAIPAPGGARDGTGDTDPQRAAPSRITDVQGTIQATVDGRPMTWYSVFGESDGKPYSSSMWMEQPDAGRMLAVGGFSTEDPPLDTFEWDDTGLPASYGTYDASVIAIAIQLPANQSGFTVTFPDGGGSNNLSYQPKATLQDVLASTFMMAEGTLSVSDVEISDGLGRVEGTFSGTFQTMTGDREVEITDGEFDVEGIPGFETLGR